MRPVPEGSTGGSRPLEAAVLLAAPERSGSACAPVHAALLPERSAPEVALLPPEGALDFEQLYERYFDFVWRNARRLGVPDASIDDAVQEVFLVVHRRIGEFMGLSSMQTWIFGILVKVVDHHRRALRRKSPHVRSGGAVVDADTIADEATQSPHDGAVRREGVRRLHGLLDELTDDQRAVFVLAELEQMSAPEIAASLGVNVNTVYARLRAARRSFEGAVTRTLARDTWRQR